VLRLRSDAQNGVTSGFSANFLNVNPLLHEEASFSCL
jgi:hypothetical protein